MAARRRMALLLGNCSCDKVHRTKDCISLFRRFLKAFRKVNPWPFWILGSQWGADRHASPRTSTSRALSSRTPWQAKHVLWSARLTL